MSTLIIITKITHIETHSHAMKNCVNVCYESHRNGDGENRANGKIAVLMDIEIGANVIQKCVNIIIVLIEMTFFFSLRLVNTEKEFPHLA